MIIRLCDATLFCVKTATVFATFNDGTSSASKPMPCCDEHKQLCQEKADHYRVTVSFKPVAPALPVEPVQAAS